MRLESNADGTRKVWLTQHEYHELLEHVTDDQVALCIRLGAEVGLRHAETAAVTPGDISESVVELDDSAQRGGSQHQQHRVRCYWLAVWGKDTSGRTDDGKRRDAFVPDDVHDDLKMEILRRNLDDDELIPYTPRTIRQWISDTGDEMAEQTGNDDWSYLSSHDLRRYYATTLLQVHSMNYEVVKEVGGWDSYEALRPYMQSPVEEVIVAEFDAAGLL